MEAHSKCIAVAVRRELRQTNGERFEALLAYYQRRGGPGLGLAELEAMVRQQRYHLNYDNSSTQ